MADIKIPKGEAEAVWLYNKTGTPVFLITYKQITGQYALYEISDSAVLTRLGKADSPTELEEKFHTKERVGCQV